MRTKECPFIFPRARKITKHVRYILETSVELMLNLARPLHGKVILDDGCGKGHLTARLAKEAKLVIGLDINSDFIKYAKSNYYLPNIDYVVGDCEHLPFKDNCFHVVICREVLEHLQNDLNGVREIARVSRNRAVISVPNYYTLPNIFFNMVKKRKALYMISHHREYGLEGFKKLLCDAGLYVVQTTAAYFQLPYEEKFAKRIPFYERIFMPLFAKIGRKLPKYSKYLTVIAKCK